MAIEKLEVLNVLKDDNGDGVALDLILEGETSMSTKQGLAAFVAKNTADDADFLNMVEQGDSLASINAQVGYVAKRKSDDGAQHLNLDDDGNLLVTSEGAKTPYSGNAKLTPTALDSEEQVLQFSLGAAGEKIDEMEVVPSSFKDNIITVYHVDDAGVGDTETLLFELRMKGSANDQPFRVSCLNLDTTGGTGTQAIRIKTNQQRGTLSPMSIFACAKAN